MRTISLKLWHAVSSSYWFIPTLMALAAVLASEVMLLLDGRLAPDLVGKLPLVYISQPAGAREVLSTIAGSMITVAGVTFSITIVALSLTSEQYGPRLLSNFMRDRGVQITLGTFVATYLYCLLVLRAVQTAEESSFAPNLSLAVGVVLSVLSLGALIYFIHHVATSIQVTTILARVSADLTAAIRKENEEAEIFPESIGVSPDARLVEKELPEAFAEEAAVVEVEKSGYLESIDGEQLMNIAKEQEVIVELFHRPGSFVHRGKPFLRVWPAASLNAALKAALRQPFDISVNGTRTEEVEFLFEALVQVALRALSPNTNDPLTAAGCLDRIEENLALLLSRDIPSPCRYDEDGHLRVKAPSIDRAELISQTLGPIRRYADKNLQIYLKLLETIQRLCAQAKDPTAREELVSEAELLRQQGLEVFAGRDLQRLLHSYETAIP